MNQDKVVLHPYKPLLGSSQRGRRRYGHHGNLTTTALDRARPWNIAVGLQPAYGLREAMARAIFAPDDAKYLPSERTERMGGGRLNISWLARTWQRGEQCTAEEWKTLARLIQEGPTADEQRAAVLRRDCVAVKAVA